MKKSIPGDVDIRAMIDDRPSDGVFRVRREVFLDPRIFELEISRIFESTWVFIGLESQVAKPHDFITTYIGRQPVILTRNAEGMLGCFLNSCRHRGTLLCPYGKGNQKFHVCRYHGWSYDSAGRNIAITDWKDGQYPEAFDAEDHGLVKVARLESYRGFIFASLSPAVPSLLEHLGDASVFLDLIAEQASHGLEYISGTVDYTFEANWKLQFENGLDFYHFASTHSSYVDILARRVRRGSSAVASGAGFIRESELNAQGTFSFPRGHAVMWSIRPGQEQRALSHDLELLARVRERVGESRAKWMMRQRNLTIFPNLQIIDIQSLQLRTWQPLAIDKTRMISHCLAPIGESGEARRFRIRQYEDFFNPSGLATSDDNVMYEFCQSGFHATAAGHTQGYTRGLGRRSERIPPYAEELGMTAAESVYGPVELGNETCFHAGYREWLRLLLAGDAE
jgi:benzoate/toluate 1,2-dioxygenase alpha subunit/2,4,5-trichlorophenoxyacetic acid oxygenase 1